MIHNYCLSHTFLSYFEVVLSNGTAYRENFKICHVQIKCGIDGHGLSHAYGGYGGGVLLARHPSSFQTILYCANIREMGKSCFGSRVVLIYFFRLQIVSVCLAFC
jgi:hypothetical protein